MPCFRCTAGHDPGILPVPQCGKDCAILATTKLIIHEVDFCAQVASAVSQLVAQNPAIYPFTEARPAAPQQQRPHVILIVTSPYLTSAVILDLTKGLIDAGNTIV